LGALPVGFVPRPVPTSPFCLRSMCQLSVSPAAFFRVKAKTAFPCLTASFFSASLEFRAALMASKAAEEGNFSADHVVSVQRASGKCDGRKLVIAPFARPILKDRTV
jgi:hypothetical protein